MQHTLPHLHSFIHLRFLQFHSILWLAHHGHAALGGDAGVDGPDVAVEGLVLHAGQHHPLPFELRQGRGRAAVICMARAARVAGVVHHRQEKIHRGGADQTCGSVNWLDGGE